MRRLLVAVVLIAVVAPTAAALAARQLHLEDTVASGKSAYVRFTTHRAAAFRVLLRVPTEGRAQLFLLGRNAPKGGPLIDTKTYACEGAAGSFYCKAAYEPLPKGTYEWRVRWVGRRPAHVELTVRW